MDKLQSDTNFMLITANVGSLFADPHRLMVIWLREFLCTVSRIQPKFLALHLQEVGGKTYKDSLEQVDVFIRCLCDAKEMQDFQYKQIYLDADFNSPQHFTALGNIYFIHKELENVMLWNFKDKEWETVKSVNIYSGNIEEIPTKEKFKFPISFTLDKKWSRKGFLRTRWRILETAIDFINIHLFHDASNLEACQRFPSTYCKIRRKALLFTLERLYSDDLNGFAPHFIFGDFNFRCDLEGIVQDFAKDSAVCRVHNLEVNYSQLCFLNSVGEYVLQIGKKQFNHIEHQQKFKQYWLKKFDKELEGIGRLLYEFPIEFHPSYPYEENPNLPENFLPTRCPAWCDRILLCPLLLDAIHNDIVSYNIIGEDVCMGDHKPIYLNFRLNQLKGSKSEYSKCSIDNILTDIKNMGLTMDDNQCVLPKSRYVFMSKSENNSANLRTGANMYQFGQNKENNTNLIKKETSI